MARYSDTNLTHLRISYNLFLKTTKEKALKKFIENSEFTDDGCLIWKGEVNNKGTGVISINSKRFGIKKIAYLTFKGDIPKDQSVFNTCQKQLCINPDHLYLKYSGYSYENIKNSDPDFISKVCEDFSDGVSRYDLAFIYSRSYYTIALIIMGYRLKLKDPRWQKKRLEIFERDGWKCTVCGDSTSELHVHHTKYIQGVEPWDVPIEFLKTLCKKHHELAHKLRKKRGRYATK